MPFIKGFHCIGLWFALLGLDHSVKHLPVTLHKHLKPRARHLAKFMPRPLLLWWWNDKHARVHSSNFCGKLYGIEHLWHSRKHVTVLPVLFGHWCVVVDNFTLQNSLIPKERKCVVYKLVEVLYAQICAKVQKGDKKNRIEANKSGV